MKVKAKLKLLKHQIEFLKKAKEKDSTYTILTAGFGSGKTDTGFFWLLDQMQIYGPQMTSANPYVVGMYEPNYSFFKLLIFPRLTMFLDKFNISYDLNISDKILFIPSFNTKIIFKSMENPAVIVGYEHNDFWIDELDTFPKDKARFVFGKILERNRLTIPNSDHENKGIITTTPEGFRFCHEQWVKNPTKGFVRVKGRTKDNIFLKPSFIENLETQHPKEILDQVLNGEFVNINGNQVYYTFNRNDSHSKMTIESYFKRGVNKELHIGMDFNVGAMSAVIAVHDRENDEIIVVDEIFGALDTPEMVEIIKERYDRFKIFVYPDSAGGARKSVNASLSDIKILQREGFLVRKQRKNPFIKDRVMAVNGFFKNSKDERRLFVNTVKCPTLTENLEQQIYDPKTGQPDKTQGQDHMLDALGYLVYFLYDVKRQLFL